MAKVTVVGGGLAGMTAALRLLERGCQVSLFEAGTRLGGKAGANQIGNDYDDHGYHIFPKWYVNTWRLVDELNIRSNFVDLEKISELRPNDGESPSPATPRSITPLSLSTLQGITSLKYGWRNLRSGFMPIPDMLLFFYAGLDLASQPYAHRLPLDRVSVTGFLNSHFYVTAGLEDQFQDMILKAITVPSYNVSAMTVRKVIRFWLKNPSPTVRILRGNLQQLFIEPLRSKLEKLGCEINLSTRLVRLQVKDSQVTHLHFKRHQEQDEVDDQEVDTLVLAIPPEQLAKLLHDDLYRVAPQLSNVLYLISQPMVAVDIYFNQRISNLPHEHVMLAGSRFGLSFIDISNTWAGYETTVLQVIASDFSAIRTLSDEEAVKLLIEELRRYLPFEKTEIRKCAPESNCIIFDSDSIQSDKIMIRRIVFQPHREAPLFLNTVGAWHFRPGSETGLSNLYLAGDYCRSDVDLVSIEAAISSGLLAAKAIGEAAHLDKPVEVLPPEEPPDWLLTLLKYTLLPFAILARLVIRIRDGKYDPYSNALARRT